VGLGGGVDAGRLPEAVNIPVDDLRSRLHDVPHDREIAVYCQVAAIWPPAFCDKQASQRPTSAAGTRRINFFTRKPTASIKRDNSLRTSSAPRLSVK
jgi:hypothetical protein